MKACRRYLWMFMLPAAFVFLKLASRRSVGSMREGEFIPIRTQEASNLLKFQIGERSAEDVRKLSYSDVVDLWQSNPRFVELFTQVLRDVPFQAYFWETPPVRSLEEQTFEFIVQKSDILAQVRGDPAPFAEHISGNEGSNCVKAFPNLGRNALLVVPCRNGDADHYAHIGKFLRSAPHEQVLEFWRTVGAMVRREVDSMGGKPLWVSTSGLGVYWLHVRLDLYPKYYTYQPYKQA